MALSNIGREPRREITESVVGILAAGAWLFAAYLIAKHFDPYYVNGKDDYGPPWWLTISFVTFLVSALTPLLLIAVFSITHWIGEEVCDWLKAIRIDPRPRQRY